MAIGHMIEFRSPGGGARAADRAVDRAGPALEGVRPVRPLSRKDASRLALSPWRHG